MVIGWVRQAGLLRSDYRLVYIDAKGTFPLGIIDHGPLSLSDCGRIVSLCAL